MKTQCPLLFRQVDATVTRINTFFVMVGISLFLLFNIKSILLYLIIDFIIRLMGYKHLSAIHRLSLYIQLKLKLPKKMEDAGAKRLAAFFGLMFTVMLLVFSVFNATYPMYLVGAVYVTCAILDTVFGFCFACYLYHLSKKFLPSSWF